ncbi:hypothetical protein RBE51_21360 [Pseudomonas taiwanensis]|uniref:hypothetical protein n=1 Tax=Pseudomonas taiwanensis TaxID=470150 RepID=UPI0028DFDCE4|nr:hypothetical protein [Pseudomonas taiwanensis]MDT8925347.1 hypothetical protein [Pseudomonas taiwanensis]
MSNQLRSEILRTVRELFRLEGREKIESCMAYFSQQMDELAQLRRFRIIADAMNAIQEEFDNLHSKHNHDTLIELLANQVDLHPRLIMTLLHRNNLSPQARLNLAKNLVEQDDYDSETLGEWFEDRWLDANEDAAILILDGIITDDRNAGIMGWGVSCLAVHACYRDKLGKLFNWFVAHEQDVINRDIDRALGSGMFMPEAFEIHEKGLTNLGLRMLPNALDQVYGFDLALYAKMLDRSITPSEAEKAGAEPTINFIATWPQPCEDLLETLSGEGLERLMKNVQDWRGAERPIIHERLQELVLHLAGNKPNEFIQSWKPFRKLIKDLGFKLDRDTVRSVYEEIGDIRKIELDDLCTIFSWAKAERITLDRALTSDRVNVLETVRLNNRLEKAISKTKVGQAVVYAKTREQGLPLPDWFFRQIMRDRYPKWPEREQQELRQQAPTFLLELSDQLLSDKLSNELGL